MVGNILGKLKKVNLREAWKHEALDFTNWLAQKENLEILSEEIGIEISLLQTEAKVGSFNVDILAQEEGNERKIIIENQLESTDHDHLGKLITYASGYDAEIIIWIVKDVRDEHKQAIDWLNEHTDENINFFAIKMELWQINDSPFAPKFQIISKPNGWAKAIKQMNNKPELTETKMLQLEFWTKFNEYMRNNDTKLRLRQPNARHWHDISCGSSNFDISLTINTVNNVLGCEIYISDSKEIYKMFEKSKNEIEDKLEEKLTWMELPNKKASRIIVYKDANIENIQNWDSCFRWLKTQAEKFEKVFNEINRRSNI